jgi:hypothetical protein
MLSNALNILSCHETETQLAARGGSNLTPFFRGGALFSHQPANFTTFVALQVTICRSAGASGYIYCLDFNRIASAFGVLRKTA